MHHDDNQSNPDKRSQAADFLVRAQDQQLVQPLGPTGRQNAGVVLDPQKTEANNQVVFFFFVPCQLIIPMQLLSPQLGLYYSANANVNKYTFFNTSVKQDKNQTTVAYNNSIIMWLLWVRKRRLETDTHLLIYKIQSLAVAVKPVLHGREPCSKTYSNLLLLHGLQMCF